VKDILAVQEDLAKGVAQEIALRLTSQLKGGSARPGPVNREAFDAYMQGYYFFQHNTKEAADVAARYYERATELDPTYALAWVGLSRVGNWQSNIGSIPGEKGQRLTREAVERALALNSDLVAVFLYSLANYALGQKKEADAALRELVTKYHAGAAFQIAEVYAFRNQSDEAFECLNSL